MARVLRGTAVAVAFCEKAKAAIARGDILAARSFYRQAMRKYEELGRTSDADECEAMVVDLMAQLFATAAAAE